MSKKPQILWIFMPALQGIIMDGKVFLTFNMMHIGIKLYHEESESLPSCTNSVTDFWNFWFILSITSSKNRKSYVASIISIHILFNLLFKAYSHDRWGLST